MEPAEVNANRFAWLPAGRLSLPMMSRDRGAGV